MRTLVLFGLIAAAVAVPVPAGTQGLPIHGALPYAGIGMAATLHAHVAAAPAIAHLPVATLAAAPIAPIVHPVAYAAPHHVALSPVEVKIPITRTHVEVPVHQQLHYGTQSYVAGATTHIHKPALAAPAIAPPTTLLSKVTHNHPDLTIKQQEIPVERHTPNFVETPYHAGTIIEYTEPEVREVRVPTPYAQPVPVPQPVHSVAVHNAVPVAYGAVIKHDH